LMCYFNSIRLFFKDIYGKPAYSVH